MKTVKVVELSIEEAREMLVDWYCNMLKSGDNWVRDLIKLGFEDHIPVVSQMGDYEVADCIGEFNLGEKIANDNGADVVMVRLNSANACLIFDRNDTGCNGYENAVAVATA